MSKFLARFGGGGKKKDAQSPNGSPSASTSARPATPASPANERRKSKQLLNFGLSSPGSVAERPLTARNQSTGTTSSTAPKIELDFGERTSDSTTIGSGLQSTGVGLQSPITGEFAIKASETGYREEEGKERRAISEAEVELLRETRFTWAQVERAWDVAGQELKVIGLQTPNLFCTATDERSTSSTSSQLIDEANRLLAISTISTSTSPSSLLSSFPSLSDYYPPVSFIPQSQEWHDNDFKTNVGWTKDPHVLVRFLKTVTQQVKTDPPKHGANNADLPEWYHRFEILERKSSYPTDAFSRLLSPLITPNQYRALWTIFDRWAVISANAAFNGCRAREVLCGTLGWWLMGARVDGQGVTSSSSETDDVAGWNSVYRAWEQARDASYHLFMAWIRDQEQTGTLPLLVLDHVKDYQERLETGSRVASTDNVTVLECRLLYQPLQASSTSTYSPSPEDLLTGVLMALQDDRTDDSSTLLSLRKWQRRTAEDVEAENPEKTVRVLDVIQAIRDTQYPQVITQHERNSSTALPQTPTAAKDDSFYRPFRTPSSSSFMNESGTPNGNSSPGWSAPRYVSPPRTPHAPISATTTPAAEARETGTPEIETENWTDFAQMGFGEAVPKPKPFVLGDAFKELRIRNGESSTHSREPRDLGMGRPSTQKESRTQYTGTYTVDSCDTTTLSVAFVEFTQGARTGRKQTESWPPFDIFHLEDETTRRFNLCAKHLLVSVRIIHPDTNKAAPPVASVPLPTAPVPLQTPPPPLERTGLNDSPSATDAEKRNRRRSFFRSFSGSSSKNRRQSSINISSPMESPLPAVAEKREPVTVPAVAMTPSPIDTPPSIQTPQMAKLSPNYSPHPSLRSRSPSSMYRKPVPALDETELRELGLAGTTGEVVDSSRTSAVQSTQTPTVNGSSMKPQTSFPSATVVDLTESEEFITADNSTTSLSVTEDSEITKSPTRRRRSGAPSPASVAHKDLEDGQITTTSPDIVAEQHLDQSDRWVVDGVSETPSGSPQHSGLENTVLPIEEQKANQGMVTEADDIQDKSQDQIIAPIMLGSPL